MDSDKVARFFETWRG